MASYSIIADVGSEIVKLLRDNLCPEPIQNPESIILCPLFEKGDYILGVHLYDIQEDGDYPQLNMIPVGEYRHRYPPVALTLFYMFIVNSQAHISSKSIDEQRILGRVIQTLYDNPVINVSRIQADAQDTDENIYISPNIMSFEDKSRVWSNSGADNPTKLALYYKAAPVLIDSTRVSRPSRVVSVGVNLNEKE